MENYKHIFKHTFIVLLLSCFYTNAQVVIGEKTIDNGAIFQLKSNDKGLMLPKVALTSRNDITTVTPSAVEGLWIYNTATGGSGLDSVTPGFYFWDGSKWVRIYNEGYTIQFEQTSTQRSDVGATVDIPGLNQNITVPYTGTYEIHVTGYIASANHSTTSLEAMVHGSYFLEIDGTKVAESNVTSNTKRTPSAFQALGRQTTLSYYVDLAAGTSYNFNVRARLWQQVNVNRTSLNVSGLCGGPSSGYAFWGICSGPYNGNSGLTDNAQDAYLTITLVRQY